MSEDKLIGIFSLENDLVVSIYDESRRIAGDRWQVSLTARIQIVTDQVQFSQVDPEKRSEILQEVGEQIYYESKQTRNFIEENQKEEIVKALCESFMQNARPYLSHPRFAERFVLKTYADSLKKRKWVNN